MRASNKGGDIAWAEVTENICQGCANNCLYCHSAYKANASGLRERSDWGREVLTQRANITNYPAHGGDIMFPHTHDITPSNLEAYIRVALAILKQGNRLLIASKPRAACIEALVDDFKPYQKQILFRFTISSMNDATCAFWEPGAPDPYERLGCLQTAADHGFKTSVAIEPMLAGPRDVFEVLEHVEPAVSENIWIGKMKKTRLCLNISDPTVAYAVANIEKLQNDEKIIEMYRALSHNPKIRWKDSVLEVVAKPR